MLLCGDRLHGLCLLSRLGYQDTHSYASLRLKVNSQLHVTTKPPRESSGSNALTHQNFCGRNHLAERRFDTFCNLEISNFCPFCPIMGKSGLSKSGMIGAKQEEEMV